MDALFYWDCGKKHFKPYFLRLFRKGFQFLQIMHHTNQLHLVPKGKHQLIGKLHTEPPVIRAQEHGWNLRVIGVLPFNFPANMDGREGYLILRYRNLVTLHQVQPNKNCHIKNCWAVPLYGFRHGVGRRAISLCPEQQVFQVQAEGRHKAFPWQIQQVTVLNLLHIIFCQTYNFFPCKHL